MVQNWQGYRAISLPLQLIEGSVSSNHATTAKYFLNIEAHMFICTLISAIFPAELYYDKTLLSLSLKIFSSKDTDLFILLDQEEPALH